MTLVLSPPGHGKSTLLKSLAGQSKITSGELLYNGQTLNEVSASGASVAKLAAYCDQVDVHMPLLTVRETFEFALKASAVDPKLLGNPELEQAFARKVIS
jgi:ABC-type multidrug transport system ATPase subunit